MRRGKTRQLVEREKKEKTWETSYSDGQLESYEITLEDFPTRKADVLTWLNRYLNTDNG